MNKKVLIALFSLLSTPAFAQTSQLPPEVLFQSQGSCATQDLSFSGLEVFPFGLADQSQINVYLYLLNDGSAAIYFNHTLESIDSSTGAVTVSVIRQEFLPTTWTALSSTRVSIKNIGVLDYMVMDGMSPSFMASLELDNSYFTEIPALPAGDAKPVMQSSVPLSSDGKTVAQICAM